MIAHLVQSPLAQALGWTLLHSLWQGAAAALLLALALPLLRAAHLRYLAACIALFALFAGFTVTLALLDPIHPSPAGTHRVVSPSPRLEPNLPNVPAKFTPEDALPWLTPLWIAGVVVFHLRGLAAWLGVRRLRQRGVCAAPAVWQQRLTRLRASIRLAKPVVLLETSLAGIPVVVGHLRPVILIPVGLLTSMPVSHVEAILLHELAHIRRRDYFVNLLQMIVEGFLFYHPAVWWISSIVRAERENCCDDLVVSESGNAGEYATALLSLEKTRGVDHQAALAATGGNLMQRIRRLLYPVENPRSALIPIISAGVLTLAAALTLMAWQSKPQEPATAAMDKYTAWLRMDVPYIITERERVAFEKLQNEQERDMFMKQFWERRGAGAKEEHYRRLGYANSHFATASSVSGWKTDRGRIYTIYGPPDEIESHPNGPPQKAFPYEQWLYHHIENVGNNVIIEFDDETGTGDYRMTRDPGVK